MNYKMIVNVLGRILCVEAVFMMPALIIALCLGERSSAMGFLAAILILAAAGTPAAVIKRTHKGFFTREGMVTVGIAWLLVSLFGALPFYISGAIPRFVDCFFETVSGFTTTGASILSDVESMPRSILYWRSFTHWLGGMGVLVFVLAIGPLAKDSGESLHLLRAESPGVNVGKLVPRMHRSAKILYQIYIVMTLIQAVLLLLGGMPVFDAVAITLGTAGTGGFGVLNDGCASYSPYCQVVITVFMVLFSINFNIFYLLLIKEFKKAFKNEELRVFISIVVLSTAIVSVNVMHMFESFGQSWRHAAFQVASIISTTGYSTVNFDLWPQLSKSLLFLLMIMGACAGSTGGGVKVVRVIMVVKSVRAGLYRMLHPNTVRLVHMDGDTVSDDTVDQVKTYMLIYFLLLAGSVMLLSIDARYDFETNFSAVMACINNIGPGFSAVGPSANFGALSVFSKLVLCLDMLFGRLELLPMLALTMPSVWRK